MTAKVIKIKEAEKMGEYTKTAIDNVKEAADIRLIAINGSYTIDVKDHVIVEGRGVKFAYDAPGRYEVTKAKYIALGKKYTCVTDF